MKKLVWHYPHLKFRMGGTKFILEIAKVLKKNYQVTLVCNLGAKEIIEEFEKSGITVRTTSFLSTNSLIYWLLFPFFFIYDTLWTSRYFSEGDIILATHFPSNLICAVYGLFTKKSFFYYCYEPFPYFHSSEFKKTFPFTKYLLLQLLSFLYGWTDKWAVRRAKKTFTLNQITKKLIKKTYGKNAIVTLMGVDTSHFKKYTQNKIKNKYKNRILITHSTDYTPSKGTDLAIKTIAKLVKKYTNILIVITSTQPDSPLKERYKNLARQLGVEKNALFSGLVPYSELPLYYGASLCYLSCSFDETLGTTSSNLPVKEALACETPAIRANITTEDVEDGISGFLVNPQDTTEVAKKIEYLIKNPKEAEEMGKRGRGKIVRLYQWEQVAARLFIGKK